MGQKGFFDVERRLEAITWARALHSFAQLRQNRQNQLLLFEVPCSSNY
jgi:hypothetical protein